MSISVLFEYSALKMEAVFSSESRYIFLRTHITKGSDLQIDCMGCDINDRNLQER
jgi:hypothetical protein